MTRIKLPNRLSTSRLVSRGVAAGIGALVIGGLLAACGSQGKPVVTPKPKATGSQSLVESFKQKIADRPAAGSAEYERAVTDKLRIPFVAGQDPVVVVKELQTSVGIYFDLGYEDAPSGEEAVVKLSDQLHTSVNGVVQALQLSYFDPGVQDALFGRPNNAYGTNVLQSWDPIKANRIGDILIGKIKPHADIVGFNAGIQYQKSDAEIMGETTATSDDNSGQTSDLHYDLRATDTDGDGSPDVWIWTGPNI